MNFRSVRLISTLSIGVSVLSVASTATAEGPPTLDWLRDYIVPRYATFGNVTVIGDEIYVSGKHANATNTAVSVDVVLNYDFSGTLQETFEVGSPARWDYVSGFESDSAGSLYLGGSTSGNIGAPNEDDYDAYLRKVTTTGSTVWNHQLGSTNVDEFRAVSLDGLGNLYYAGAGAGNLLGESQGANDALIGKRDTDGNLLWSRQFGGAQDDSAMGIAADSLGNVFVAGFTVSDLAGAVGGSDAFLAKFDASGNQQWLQQYGSSSNDDVRRLAADGLGNVYALEWIDRRESRTYRVSKYASDGTSLWNRIIGTDDSVLSVSALTLDKAGNIYVGGGTKLDLAGENDGELDAFISKYSPSGDALWTYQIGTNNGGEWIHDVWADEQGRIVVVGETNGSFTIPTYDYAVAAWVALLQQRHVPEPQTAIMAIFGAAILWATRLTSRAGADVRNE